MIDTPILRVKELCKSIKGKPIVKNISFDIYAGEVFGFLGPNGSGKTTTIRMLVDLIKPTSGSIELNGQSLGRHHREALAQIGCIVENPELYPYLTGYENLKMFAGMLVGVDENRIQEVIRIVGLESRIFDCVNTYSLGMRQRLGIAQALLGQPKLLILDEPTNGLDPQGIKEMRSFIRSLANQGIAIFVSSHLLSEIQFMCDRVGIILAGQLIKIGQVKDLLLGKSNLTYWDVSDANKAKHIFSDIESVVICTNESDEATLPMGESIFTKHDGSLTPTLIESLSKQGVSIYAVHTKKDTLEDLFLRITEGDSIG